MKRRRRKATLAEHRRAIRTGERKPGVDYDVKGQLALFKPKEIVRCTWTR